MSINSAMLSGVSGMIANSDALSAISNNIANVNTVGYKVSNATFESLVTAQAGGGAATAGGVTEKTTQVVTQQGLTTQTGSPTDISISGQGFFVATSNSGATSPTNPALFTRAGSFSVDSQGYLQNTAGLYLQGWPVDTSGNVTPDATNLANLASINVTSLASAPEKTSQIAIDANLESSQSPSAAAAAAATVPAGAGAYDPTANSMAVYNPTTGAGVKPDFSIQVPVADSQGGQRTVQLDFLKSAAQPNQWYAEIVAVPASDVTSGNGVPGQIAAGILAFTPTGQIDPTNTTLFGGAPMPSSPTITFGASTAGAPAANTANWAPGLGILGQTVAFDLTPGSATSGSSGVTQFDSPSATQTVTTNGTPFGNLSSVQIGADGFVTAEFDNGVSRKIAQVSVATFINPDGLTSVSGDAYQASLDSGTYTLKTPGSGGAGLLNPKTLEDSTVDLSTEFSNLITTQRAYSASSKIITTADQMLQELINMKQ